MQVFSNSLLYIITFLTLASCSPSFRPCMLVKRLHSLRSNRHLFPYWMEVRISYFLAKSKLVIIFLRRTPSEVETFGGGGLCVPSLSRGHANPWQCNSARVTRGLVTLVRVRNILPPCDLHVFPPMAEALSNRGFGTDQEVNNAAREWLSKVERNFFVIERVGKTRHYGDYVEK